MTIENKAKMLQKDYIKLRNEYNYLRNNGHKINNYMLDGDSNLINLFMFDDCYFTRDVVVMKYVIQDIKDYINNIVDKLEEKDRYEYDKIFNENYQNIKDISEWRSQKKAEIDAIPF